jgi:rare lipoprotein A
MSFVISVTADRSGKVHRSLINEMTIPLKPPPFWLTILFAMFTMVLTVVPRAIAGAGATAKDSSKAHVRPGETLIGKATYYPNSLNGHKASSGQTFRQNANTAASNKLPLGTGAKVTNLKNGKTAGVMVTDHGGKLGTHKIDLSKKAANEIGLTRKEGTVPVKNKVMRVPDDHPS